MNFFVFGSNISAPRRADIQTLPFGAMSICPDVVVGDPNGGR